MRQLLETGVISLDFVRSELNLDDPPTKPLNRKLVERTNIKGDKAFAYYRSQR